MFPAKEFFTWMRGLGRTETACPYVKDIMGQLDDSALGTTAEKNSSGKGLYRLATSRPYEFQGSICLNKQDEGLSRVFTALCFCNVATPAIPMRTKFSWLLVLTQIIHPRAKNVV